MKKSKKLLSIILPAILATASLVGLASCVHTPINNTNISQLLNTEITKLDNFNFQLKKPTLTVQELDAMSEDNILEYLDELPINNALQYKVVDLVKQDNQIAFKINISHNELTQTTKTIILNFSLQQDSNTIQNNFDQAYNNFSLKIKSNVQLNHVFASDLNTENDLLKYFDVHTDLNTIKYSFVSITHLNYNEIAVKYLLTSTQDNKISNKKTLKLSGFANPNEYHQNEFEKLFQQFTLTPKVSVSNVLAETITSEQILLQYFQIPKINNLKVKFVSVVVNPFNNTQLNVTYKLTLLADQTIFANKQIILTGFQKPLTLSEKFDQYYNQFSLQTKPNVQLNTILASTIQNESDIQRYFDVIASSELKFQFISVNTMTNNFSTIQVKYQLTLNADPNLTNEKTLVISGFKKELSVAEQKLQQALSIFKITDRISHNNLSVREFMESPSFNFQNYFEYNEDAIHKIDKNIIVDYFENGHA